MSIFIYLDVFCQECDADEHLMEPAEMFNAGRKKRQVEEGVDVRDFETTILVQLPSRFGAIHHSGLCRIVKTVQFNALYFL